jgi:hypothetical protein
MSKMGFHDPFGYLKHKLWSKEGPIIKLPIWFSTIKNKESPWFIYAQVACHILLKRYWQGLQICFRLTSIRGLHRKLWAPKVVGVVISRLWIWGPKTKWHLGVGPMARKRENYKGDVGGFPQDWTMVSPKSLCLPVACPCTKNAPTMHLPTCYLVCANPCD